MKNSDKTILLYIVNNPGWHLPSTILKKTELKGRDLQKKMTINNIMKRCKLLVNESFLKTPDPERDRDIYRMKEDGVYCVNESTEAFKKFVTEFIILPEWCAFHTSTYCQNMVTPPLLREIEKQWNIGIQYPSKVVVEKAIEDYSLGKEIEKLPIEEKEVEGILVRSRSGSVPMRPYWNYGYSNFFTEEDVLEILKLSSTALKNALSGSIMNGKSCFEEMLLASIILDSSTRLYPLKYEFIPKLSIEIHRPGKEPFIKSAGTRTIHL